MRRWLALGALCAVLATGCGGGSSGSGSTANPYAGSYSGRFKDSIGTIGSFTLGVSNTGGVGGQLGYAPIQSFTGSINSQGTGTLSLNGLTPTITLGANGQLTMDGAIDFGTGTGTFFTVVSNPTGRFGITNPFSGDFAGTQRDTTLGITGIAAINISKSGVVSGYELVSVSGTPTLSSIAGTLSGTGALSYTVAANSVTFSGSVSLSNGTISGNLTGSNSDSATISITQVD